MFSSLQRLAPGFFGGGFYRLTFVGSFFSSPPQQPMTFDFEGFSIPDFIHYIYYPILILEKEPVLNPGPPAIEASTLPLGYRGSFAQSKK